MKIKKFAAAAMVSVMMCTASVSVYAAEEITAIAEEVLENNQIDSLISDPDKIADIILYVKDYIGSQDITDDTVQEAIDIACSALGISLSDSEKDSLVSIFNTVKDMDIDEEQLRSQIAGVYEGLESLGIGKEEVKGFLAKAVEFVKGILN